MLALAGALTWWGGDWIFGNSDPATGPSTGPSENGPETVTAAELTGAPRKYSGSVVEVEGRVVRSASLWVQAYLLADSTGRLIVTTDKAVPPRGRRVRVIGEARQFAKLGGQQLFLIREHEARIEKSPASTSGAP